MAAAAKQKKKGGIGGLLLGLTLVLIALAATNPDREHFRDLMRSQGRFVTTAASYLPIKRTNYVFGSKFEIQYGIGKTVCYAAAYTLVVCPEPEGRRNRERGERPRLSDEAAPTGAE